MKTYSPKDHWDGLAENFHSTDAAGFAPVLHPDAPAWFNHQIDKSQFRAIRRAVVMGEIARGARVLDVGCGTGRWVRRYRRLGFGATGIDRTPRMLRLARERGAEALIAGEAERLPFADAAFDLVSDVTVVQHIPAPIQLEALREMVRVLRPGGCLILMELIRGQGLHIFPRDPQGWVELAVSCGVKPLGWFGQEYLLLDRLFARAVQALRRKNGSARAAAAIPQGTSPWNSTMARRVYWGLRHVTVPLSAWADPFVEKFCPGRYATHGVFVFRK
jgi:ubiquinone/menaquinone biosynthesis C-methylase UbiE